MAKRIHVRPGKGQSKFSFIVGIFFCIFGIFVAIPVAGLFGVVWTAVAAGITFMNYKNGFTDEQIDSHVIDIEDDGTSTTMSGYGKYRNYTFEEENVSNGNDMEDRLRKLQSLYDQSLITYDEYEQKKKEILDEL